MRIFCILEQEAKVEYRKILGYTIPFTGKSPLCSFFRRNDIDVILYHSYGTRIFPEFIKSNGYSLDTFDEIEIYTKRNVDIKVTYGFDYGSDIVFEKDSPPFKLDIFSRNKYGYTSYDQIKNIKTKEEWNALYREHDNLRQTLAYYEGVGNRGIDFPAVTFQYDSLQWNNRILYQEGIRCEEYISKPGFCAAVLTTQ